MFDIETVNRKIKYQTVKTTYTKASKELTEYRKRKQNAFELLKNRIQNPSFG